MKSKLNIRIMYAIALLQGMVFYGPIATLYRQSAGISVFQITIIESISLALCLLLELPWGMIADKIGYKKTMLFCCFLYFVSKIVFWKANGFVGFLAERILLSIIIAGLSGVDSSILYLSCKEKESQKVFSIYHNLSTVGLLFAALIYSIVVKEQYRLAGFFTVISYGIAALLSLGLKEVHSPKETEHTASKEFCIQQTQTLKNRHLLLFLVGVALVSETHQTITVFLNQLQYVKCGLSSTAIGYCYIVVTVAGLLGVFSAKLMKRFKILPFASALYLVILLSCVILSITDNAVLSVLSIVMLRISFNLFYPLQMDLQNKQVLSSNRATALSINAVLIDSIGVGTNVIFGKLADVNLSITMFLGAMFSFLGLLLFLIWYQNYKRTLSS